MGLWPVLNSRSLAPNCISSPVHKSCPECLPAFLTRPPWARRAAFAWNRVTSTLGAAAGPAALSPFPASHPRASVRRICRRPLPGVERSHSGSGTEDGARSSSRRPAWVSALCLSSAAGPGRDLGCDPALAFSSSIWGPRAAPDKPHGALQRRGWAQGRKRLSLCFLSAGNTPCAYSKLFLEVRRICIPLSPARGSAGRNPGLKTWGGSLG